MLTKPVEITCRECACVAEWMRTGQRRGHVTVDTASGHVVACSQAGRDERSRWKLAPGRFIKETGKTVFLYNGRDYFQ